MTLNIAFILDLDKSTKFRGYLIKKYYVPGKNLSYEKKQVQTESELFAE